jgi:ribosomal protein S27AE
VTASDEKLASFYAEIFREHPDYEHDPDREAGWPFEVLTVVEPCERCGQRIVLVRHRDMGVPPRWYGFGCVYDGGESDGPRIQLLQHTAEACAQARSA